MEEVLYNHLLIIPIVHQEVLLQAWWMPADAQGVLLLIPLTIKMVGEERLHAGEVPHMWAPVQEVLSGIQVTQIRVGAILTGILVEPIQTGAVVIQALVQEVVVSQRVEVSLEVEDFPVVAVAVILVAVEEADTNS